MLAVSTSNRDKEPDSMRIAIASDHAALKLKAELAGWLTGEGH
ncbi:hypothetical protein [Caulobacter sp. DWP3-1-3b2]